MALLVAALCLPAAFDCPALDRFACRPSQEFVSEPSAPTRTGWLNGHRTPRPKQKTRMRTTTTTKSKSRTTKKTPMTLRQLTRMPSLLDEAPPHELPEDERARVQADLARTQRGSFVIPDRYSPDIQEEVARRILADDQKTGRIIIRDLNA